MAWLSFIYPLLLSSTFSHTLPYTFSISHVCSALGFIVGAEAASFMNSWRWALRVSPPIGIFLALVLFFFTRDPPRGAADAHVSEKGTDYIADESVEGAGD